MSNDAATGAGGADASGPPTVSGNAGPPGDRLDLNGLAAKVEELITICDRLREENQALKSQQANLMAERAQLIERSELARSRVEAMIARLKAMETGS